VVQRADADDTAADYNHPRMGLHISRSPFESFRLSADAERGRI